MKGRWKTEDPRIIREAVQLRAEVVIARLNPANLDKIQASFDWGHAYLDVAELVADALMETRSRDVAIDVFEREILTRYAVVVKPRTSRWLRRRLITPP